MTVNYQHPDLLIRDAVLEARRTHPYYASSLERLRIVADASVPTMATSKHWVTHYNPETLKSWTPSERAAVLVHELEHLLREHSERCGDRDPGNWNIAADAEINQRLNGLPDGAVYPETLGMPRGRAAETYYAATSQQAKSDPQSGDGDGSGDESGDGAGQPGSGQPGKCGSSAGGPEQAHEQGDAQRPGPGGVSPEQTEAVRKDAARRVLQSGPGIGTDPGDELREWAMGELNIDRNAWYNALASAVGRVAAPYGAPTRWRWPGRRDPRDMGGAMVPRWVGERPSVAVVIDTSGSITPFDLEMAKAAGHYISRVADATFYGCDTVPVRYGATMPERIVGGGGTRLDVGIAMAIEDGAKAVVVITDCENNWSQEPWPVPVIVGANPSAHNIVQAGPGGYYYPPEPIIVLSITTDAE